MDCYPVLGGDEIKKDVDECVMVVEEAVWYVNFLLLEENDEWI